jgi:hypothetical protein
LWKKSREYLQKKVRDDVSGKDIISRKECVLLLRDPKAKIIKLQECSSSKEDIFCSFVRKGEQSNVSSETTDICFYFLTKRLPFLFGRNDMMEITKRHESISCLRKNQSNGGFLSFFEIAKRKNI